MSSNRKIVLTPEAESDLADIVQYGAETWGVRQADAYSELIWDKLSVLAKFPAIGQKRGYLMSGLLSHAAGEHLIFYRFTEGEVIVRRLIHSHQDIESIDWRLRSNQRTTESSCLSVNSSSLNAPRPIPSRSF